MINFGLFAFRLQRFLRAISYGFFYIGFKKFQPPRRILNRYRLVDLEIPHDESSYQSFIEIFLDDTYFLRLADLPSHGVIVDIGGNIGLFATYAKIMHPKSKIYSIEPNIKVLPALEKNSKFYGFKVIPVAVTESHQSISIIEGVESHLMAKTQIDCNGKQLGIPFSEILASVGGKIDFLKMDCEGAEWDVFSTDVDWQRVRYISLEYHELGVGKKFPDAVDALHKNGFAVLCVNNLSGYGMIFAKNTNFRG